MVTGTVATIGLSNWRREATFEVARALARATYKVRDEVRNCRAPWLVASELPHEYGLEGNPTYKQTADGIAHAYENRWRPLWEAVQSFDACTLEAEAVWGHQVRVSTDKLRQCIRDLHGAIDAMVANARNADRDFMADRKLEQDVRSKISSGQMADDKFGRAIVEAIEGIESVVRPHLRRT